VRRLARASLLALSVTLAVGCTDDDLDPDITFEDDDDLPPATDTRTSDPPLSTLPSVTDP
jgi:hypothetical protein